MAKLKKAARTKTTSRKPAAKSTEAAPHNLISTAQQIWAAGVGALIRAQGESTDMFEALVKKGMSLEAQTRKIANSKVDGVRANVEDRVENVREKATDTWDRMEKVFEDRVQRALTRLGVPTREDLTALTKRVEVLTAELRKQNVRAASLPAKKSTTAQVKKATKKIAPAKKTAKTVLPKAPMPQAPKA